MNNEIEIWKDIEGYEGLYQVSSWGNIKSLNYNHTGKEKIIKPTKNKDGYLYLNLWKDGKRKNLKVHRLVCSTFLENLYNLPCVNHKDENKENNRVDNLEWCTHEYNNNYGTKLQRQSEKIKGKISPNRKPILQFSLDNVFIREWDSATTASKELNINNKNISRCCNGNQKTCGGYIWRFKDTKNK